MDYAARQAGLAAELAGWKVDALLVTHMPNVRYLCGFTGSAGVLVARAERSVLVTDGRYTEQARDEVRAARVVISKHGALAECPKLMRSGVVGLESEHVTLAMRAALSRLFGRAVRLKPVGAVIERQRMIKDAGELAQLRAAVLSGAKLFEVAVRALRPGATEAAVAGAMEHAARKAGADGMSFDTIVASGPRSALPHGRASAAAVARRGFCILDFGVILAGYCSDMTRTVHLGRVDARARGMYDAVREAQLAGEEAVRPGATAGDVDRAARRVLQRAGFGRFFTHSTGHGVGLEIHEPPRIGRNQPEELKPGMVITIEPGIYLPGVGGVRIEDMVAVTESGCEVLTPTAKELIVC